MVLTVLTGGWFMTLLHPHYPNMYCYDGKKKKKQNNTLTLMIGEKPHILAQWFRIENISQRICLLASGFNCSARPEIIKCWMGSLGMARGWLHNLRLFRSAGCNCFLRLLLADVHVPNSAVVEILFVSPTVEAGMSLYISQSGSIWPKTPRKWIKHDQTQRTHV